MREMNNPFDLDSSEGTDIPQALAARLSADAERLRSDPSPLLHARIMASVKAGGTGRRPGRRGDESVSPVPAWNVVHHWRVLAVAACLLLAIGLIVVLSQNSGTVGDDPTNVAQDAPAIVNDERALVEEPGDTAPENPSSALASIQSIQAILEPLPQIEREMTAPLRTELDRLAASGGHLLRSTFAAMPSSLRGAGR